MKPIYFEGARILRRPDGMTEKECGPLAIIVVDGTTCVSCWRPSLWERLNILWAGKVWVGVLSGQTQPPIYLTVNKPFKINE